MTYFMLNPECYFIRGVTRAAVYNLHTGNVFSVGVDLRALLSACDLERKPIHEAGRFTGMSLDEVRAVLDRLRKARLGRFYEAANMPPIIEKLKPGERKNFQGRATLKTLHIELTSQCNLDCVFCDREGTSVRRKYGCARWGTSQGKSRLRRAEWEEVVSDGAKLSCRELIFTGGEPLLAWEDFSNLLQLARRSGYRKITLETNGCMLDEDKVAFLRDHDVLVRLQLFSFKESVHDGITRVSGSFARTSRTLEVLAESKVRFTFVLPIIDLNEDHWVETMEWFDGHHVEDPKPMFIYPQSLDCFEHVAMGMLGEAYKTSKKPFGDVKATTFFDHAQCNPWFHGRIAVTCYGDVLPCPMAREEVIANVRDTGLAGVFRTGAMLQYWLLTKDDVEICQDCEYRYACVDNRPLERSLSGRPKGRSGLCTYDPYKGEWMDTTPATERSQTVAV